ncbi:ABC transporter permease [Ferruginibacter albus]|nr:ABC transporter permease [Ferruginibacter albus]
MTFQELKVNKLRTVLSLIGVAFGIFCIVGVLATVNSFEVNLQNEIKSLGSNTIFIDRWDYSGGPDKPMWKYRARPVMKYEEASLIMKRTQLLDAASFVVRDAENVSYGDNVVQNSSVYGVTESQSIIQPMRFESGRYISDVEFNSGSAVALIGFDNAEKLFGIASRALGKEIEMKGKKITIVGVFIKEGKNFVGWDYDNCVMIPYNLCKQLIDVDNSNPVIIAKGKEGVATTAVQAELEGVMRQIRRLSPTTEDNFTLNSVEAFSKAVTGLFGIVDLVGALIGVISLIVGMFGIANIMFVTVKERTPVIGLKKAIGAKSRSILFEFLMEAAILCLLGGFIGLIFVYILTLVLSGPLNFPVFISVPLLIATVILCIVVGILAGIFPASRAAKLDPVVAIRS